MPGKELYPNQGDSRGNFRHGTNRQVEITLKKELDDVAKKSFQEIIYKKDQNRKVPLDETEYTSRRLQPAFIPQKVKEKRKTQPVFHDDVPAKEAKQGPKFQLVPNIPPYNPLNKSGKLKAGEKTKKFPYVKEDTVTTKEMKKPHVTSLGVTPARDSIDVPALKVIMEGRTALTEGDSMLDEMAIANKMRPTTPVSPVEKDQEMEEEEDLITDRSAVLKKPAILSSEGTTARVQFMARQKPVLPATSLKKYRKKTTARSALSMASSLQSDNIQLPDEAIYSQYDDVIAGLDADLENVQTQLRTLEDSGEKGGSRATGIKSSKELLEEARRISRPGSEVVIKKKKESPRKRDGKKEGKKSGKDKSKGKGKEQEAGEDVIKPRTERTVDEIISSLRAGSGAAKVSEADRKIQEIMERVMSHASAVLYDDDKQIQPTPEVVEEAPQPVYSESGTDADPYSSSQTPYESVDISSPNTGEEHSGLSSPYDQADEKKEATIQKELAEEGDIITDRTQADADGTKAQQISQTEGPAGVPTSKTDLKLSDFMISSDNIQPPEVKGMVSFDALPHDDRLETPPLDIRQIYEDLMAPPQATYEDLVSVEGKPLDLADRQVPQPVIPQSTVQSSSVSFLSSWKPMSPRKYPPPTVEKGRQLSTKNIHHFCTLTSDYQLPEEFHNLGRKYHTPNKYEKKVDHPYRFGSTGPSIAEPVDEETASQISKVSETRAAEEQRLVSAARRILLEADKDVEGESREESFELWKQRAEEVFTQADVAMQGAHINLKSDESRLFWAPAPPKLDVPPAIVKEVLFPQYQPSLIPQASRAATSTQQEDFEDSEEEEEEEEVIDADRERYNEIYRLIYHKSKSSEDLTQLMLIKDQREMDIKARKIDPYEKRKLLKGEVPPLVEEEVTPPVEEESRESTPIGPMAGTRSSGSSLEYIPVFPLLRRSRSDPCSINLDDDTLLVPQDYNTAMDEIKRQKKSIKQMKINRRLEEIKKLEEDERESAQATELPHDPSQSEMLVLSAKKKDEPTPAELALEAGRAYVILPKKSKKKKKRAPVSMARLDEIEKFLNMPPRLNIRRSSMITMAKPVERELRVPGQVKSRIRRSVPDIFNFREYSDKKGYREGEDMREWVRDIWNKWFDEVFPPSESEEEYEDEEMSEIDGATGQEGKTDKKRRDSVTSSLSESFDVIEPLEETEENMELIQIIVEEIERLNEEIASKKRIRAFDYCRRGALCRKIGMVKQAEEDLNKAIQMEPLMLDAFWHRHLLYLLQDNKQGALDDLHFILKHSKKHSGAYRSIAEIYRKQGDITKAVVNYSQAIKQNPMDHEAYFQRALMYEKRGEMLLALEDFSKVKKIKPTRIDAILRHGMYYFENKNWTNAINDFTDLLKVEPLDASARMYRGRAYARMKQWTPAVQDLSAAIHLDPNSWQAFYHRACILRNAHPKRALHDYSVSLLINDTEENVMSYLHRGILYDAIGRHEDAIPDFESVLKLNKDIACAHTNLGLIFMNHYENYHRAIKKFSAGIKVDPTYVRAYVCRGEAYHKIHELKLALRDFTRAIHLRPDVHHYYMYRGQLVLEMGNLDLAAFCVRHASELSSDSSLGQMPTQQAVVQSFLKNYDKAIEALQIATRANPVGSLFMLLGKTQMKAKRYMEGVDSFKRAIEIYTPWKPREPWPQEAAEAHYLIGMCHMELKNYLDALAGFTEAIKLDPNYAEALYQRGVAKMKQHISKGIQDFNRALAINPKIFQAYLSRACYYGYKKNYTKAILNCNEATKLQPKSVRAYLYRGALKYHIKAFDLAIRDLTTAASIDSQCSLAYFNRAVCYQEKKDYQKALTDYGIVLLLGQDLTLEVYINRGLLYFERMDYINALYDFKLAAKLKTDQRILHTLGLCYHKMDKLREALDVFTACITKNPAFLDGIIARGNVYMDFGGEEGLRYARRDYERALMKDPLCLPARVNLAYTLQVSGKYMQAWVQFTTAIALKPTFKPALEGRAIINLQMSNTFAAFQDINASLKVGATAELYTNRGVINQFMQDRVNSMRDYQMALQLDPTYALAYFNAANVYFHTRHFQQALDYFTKAISYKPKDESAYLNRAITKVMLRDFQGALDDFKSAIKLSPYTAHMYFNRGNLYASMEQYDLAEKDYSKSLSLKPDDALVLKRRADVRGKLGMKAEAIKDYRQAVEIQSRLRAMK